MIPLSHALTHSKLRRVRAFGRLRHVLQLQIFHGHPSVILCDGVGRLKHEVPTNVADTTMVIQNLRLQSSAHAAGLPLVERVCLAQLGKLLTSFLVAAKLALKYGDLLFVLLDPASRQKITQSPETKQTLLLKALFNRGFFLAPRWVHMI